MLESLPRILIAGTHSGVGKTTVSSVICAGLVARGLRVQAFKVGPDYLDPTHLSRASGREARNLDGFMLSENTLAALFHKAARRCEISIFEGVMGLFDGKLATGDDASSADLACKLEVPLVLVMDVSGTARSAAAMALGFKTFNSDLNFAGVILNRVGSSDHAQLCQQALEQIGIRVFGFLLQDATIGVSERHLGLVAANESRVETKALEIAAQTLDLTGLLEVANDAPTRLEPESELPAESIAKRAVIAVARDAAFNFYYPDALELLEDLGVKLEFFSPLNDSVLPKAGALFLGGGYPELFAAQLSANTAMLEQVRDFAASDKPVLAECGGLMYLAESLTDLNNQEFAMCAVLLVKTRMLERPKLGYREVKTLQDSPIALAGTVIRGHEFHYSSLIENPTCTAYQYQNHQHETQFEGFNTGNILASYLHHHFASDVRLAQRFVTLAAQHSGGLL